MPSYDERLLAAAPAATREEKQDGYKLDLLHEDATRRTGTSSPDAHVALASNHGHAEAALASKEALESYPPRRAVPWWRTKKGITVLVIVAIVAIAAIVGGAVGGTVNKHSNKNSNDSSASSVSTASGDTGNGQAQATGDGSLGGSGPNATGGQVEGGTSTAAATPTSTQADPNPQVASQTQSAQPVIGVVSGSQ